MGRSVLPEKLKRGKHDSECLSQSVLEESTYEVLVLNAGSKEEAWLLVQHETLLLLGLVRCSHSRYVEYCNPVMWPMAVVCSRCGVSARITISKARAAIEQYQQVNVCLCIIDILDTVGSGRFFRGAVEASVGIQRVVLPSLGIVSSPASRAQLAHSGGSFMRYSLRQETPAECFARAQLLSMHPIFINHVVNSIK